MILSMYTTGQLRLSDCPQLLFSRRNSNEANFIADNALTALTSTWQQHAARG